MTRLAKTKVCYYKAKDKAQDLERKELRAKKQAEQDEKWDKLCTAQKKLMREFPEARYSFPNQSTYEAVYTRTIAKLGSRPDYFRLKIDHFDEPLRALIHAEEAWEHTEMRRFDLKQIVLKPVPGDQKFRVHYQCSVPGISKGQPSLIPTDGLILSNGSEQRRMIIVDIDGDRMTFRGLDPKGTLQITGRYDIAFVPSGMCYDRFLNTLKEVKANPRFMEILFGGDPLIDRRLKAKIDFVITGTEDLDRRIEKCNTHQKRAIINILEAKCRPNLYILFGPPGTGKTYTLVETVVQIHCRNKQAKILVCSGSNTCVDGIAEMLSKTGKIGSMTRLSSKFHYLQSKYQPDYYSIDPRETPRYNVVVTTNMMVSRITKAYYDYVLIDEAGHSHIPETLIPITKLHKDGCLVLAGDPRQLGPVIKSFEVERLGLGMSLLERMCEREMYSRDTHGYDERYITKLIRSYRCDPRILGLSNILFYQGDLKCLGRTPLSILKILQCNKPLVFMRVRGYEVTSKNSTSRSNRVEASAVIKYLFRLYKMGLEPDQIGIITPYVLQKEILMDEFKKQIQTNRQLLDQRFKIPRMTDSTKRKAKQHQKPPDMPLTNGLKSLALDDIESLSMVLSNMQIQAKKVSDEGKKSEAQFMSKKGPKMDWLCKIDTVDAFQGSEREVILMSTVRCPTKNGSIEQCGFLSNAKRFNVTVSRAKWLVVAIGHPAVLNCCNYWRKYGEESAVLDWKKL